MNSHQKNTILVIALILTQLQSKKNYFFDYKLFFLNDFQFILILINFNIFNFILIH